MKIGLGQQRRLRRGQHRHRRQGAHPGEEQARLLHPGQHRGGHRQGGREDHPSEGEARLLLKLPGSTPSDPRRESVLATAPRRSICSCTLSPGSARADAVTRTSLPLSTLRGLPWGDDTLRSSLLPLPDGSSSGRHRISIKRLWIPGSVEESAPALSLRRLWRASRRFPLCERRTPNPRRPQRGPEPSSGVI